MKKSFHSVACAATIATTMLLQIFAPSVVLAIDTTEDTEPSTTIETTVTSETSSETSVDVVEPSDTTSDSTDYTVVTEDLTETEADVTEVTEEEVISSETNTDPTDEVEETEETEESEEIIEITSVDVASSQDEFDSFVSGISEDAWKVTVYTSEDLIGISADDGIWYEGTYVFYFVTEEAYNDAVSYLTEGNYNFVVSEPVEDVFITVVPMAETEDEFNAFVNSIDNDEYWTITVHTSDDLVDIVSDGGIWYDGTYVFIFDTQAEFDEAVEILTNGGYDYQTTVKACHIIFASSREEFNSVLANLPGASTIIVSTTDDLTELYPDYGVYFDGTYVIGYRDQRDYDNAIDFLIENGYDYSENGNMSICAVGDDFSVITNADINPEATVRVAVIDTGSNIANEYYSVVGDDGADENGHGTQMVSNILNETDNAYIISIKAMGLDGHGGVDDVYAALEYARELDVDYILLAISIRDNGKYEALRTLITDIVDEGIVVVASAGNNNRDASDYIPAGIDGVLTAGAINDDGTKYPMSNYGECVEYYVYTTSTSNAASILTGRLLNGNTEDISTYYVESGEDFVAFVSDSDSNEFTVDGNASMTWLTAADLQNAGYSSTDEFRQALLTNAAAIAAEGHPYAWSGANNMDCGTFINSVYAQTLYGSYTNGGSYYQLNDGNPYHLYTANGSSCVQTWANTAPHNIGSGGTPIVGSMASTLTSLGAQPGDIIILGRYCRRATRRFYTNANHTATETCTLTESASNGTSDGWNPNSDAFQDRVNGTTTPEGYISGFYGWVDSTWTFSKTSTWYGFTHMAMLDEITGETVWVYDAQNSNSPAGNHTLSYSGTDDSRKTWTHVAILQPATAQVSSASFLKVDDTGTPLAGAVFTLTSDTVGAMNGVSASNPSATPSATGVLTFTSQTTATTFTGLHPNTTYTFTEITPPPGGYSLAAPVSVTTTSTGSFSSQVRVVNSIQYNGGVNFRKISSTTDTYLPNAQIYLVCDDTGVNLSGVTVSGTSDYTVGTTYSDPTRSGLALPAIRFVTGASNISFDGLPSGHHYRFIETDPPRGYSAANPMGFFVNADGSNTADTGVPYSGGLFTMTDHPVGAYGSLGLEKVFETEADMRNFYNSIYQRGDLNNGYPFTADNQLWFSMYWLSADREWSERAIAGSTSYLASPIAEGRITNQSSLSQTVEWRPGEGYESYCAGISNVWGALPFRWVGTDGTASDVRSTVGVMGYLAEGYYWVSESWYTGTFGRFHGNHNAEALYIQTLNEGGWIPRNTTGLFRSYYKVYHVTPSATYPVSIVNGSFVDGPVLTRVENAYSWGNYANPGFYDTTTLVNSSTAADFDLTKVDSTGMGVDGVSFSLWAGDAEVAIGYVANPNSPTTNSEGNDVYDISWEYMRLTGDVGHYVNQTGIIWAQSQERALWIVRNWLYAADGGVFGEAPANYTIPSNWHTIIGTHLAGGEPVYYNPPQYNWYYQVDPLTGEIRYDLPMIQGEELVNYYTDTYEVADWVNQTIWYGAFSAVGGPDGSAGTDEERETAMLHWGRVQDYNIDSYYNLGNNMRYGGVANTIQGLPLGTYQIREYYDPDVLFLDVPDGWSGPVTDSIGTYFYRDIEITEDYNGHVYNIELTNQVLGKIDVSKVNLTGGPLSDLSFEIFDRDTGASVATGYIPADAAPETTGTRTASDYTYSVSWDYSRDGTDFTNRPEANVGLGHFEVREYIPSNHYESIDDFNLAAVGAGWSEIRTDASGRQYVAYEIDIDDNNASITQIASIRNSITPIIGTTMTDFADRHITVVGENIEFTDVVSYEGAYIGGSYIMHATLMDAASGQPVRDEDGNVYEADVPFTANAGSGTVNVTFTVNTADLVEATQDANGVVSYSPRAVVCFESMRLVGDYEIVSHNDLTDQSQTVEIPNPEIGTTFYDLQTEEHVVPAGRVVEVVDRCSYTNLHVGEHYSLTCFLYDQTTGNQLMYSDNTPVVGRLDDFVPQTESGTVDVTFTIDTSDLIVNVFQYEERTLVAFEYLRTESGILIGGHTDINDLAQHNRVPTPTVPRSLLLDDQTGTHEGVIGAAVTMTDTLWFEGLNIGESYQIRGSIVDRDNPNIVYATVVQDFEAQARNDSVQIQYTVDTSMVCEGNREAYLIEQLWQLDTQNTGRGEVLLARHEDVRDQDQSIHLVPEIHTTMNDIVTNSHYGMIGEDVVLEDTVAYYNLHIGETYTVTGVLMDKQTGLPVTQNGQVITSTTTFVAPTQDGTVVVTYHVNTLELINQIGQTVNGITITAPREVVSFETITSSSHYDFAIHSDINDQGQTIICGDISSGAGDTQTSTSWLASGLTTVHDNVHYRGLGPVEYTLRGSLHLVDYDENGNPIDGGLIQARPGEVVELEHTWTPSNHEGDVGFDFKLDSDRFQGRNIVVFEELWYNGVCIISHENYSDSMGNYGMANTEQTVHVASVWTSAFSFQSGEQLLAYDTEAKVTDFVYYGNVEVGQDYYCEASLWACYTDEAGQIHSVAISQADGGVATSPVFRATENHGIAEVTFTIDSTKLFDEHYDYLLVTERLIHVGSGVCIATHSDLTSKEQSINIPDLHTTATTATGHTLPEGENPDIVPVTITDRVYYENLICDGRSYTVVGNLQYARTDANGNITESGPLMQNGQAVTATKTFVPEASTGYIDLEFTVNAADIFAHNYDRIVVFEDLYFGPEGIRVGVHADITDQEQTITPPDLQTTALGANGRHNVQATANTEIIDTVAYTGLTPGREYRLETDLMSSKTGGSIAHVTTTFVPTTPDGVVTVSMTADLTGYGAGDKVVVFENCYDNGTGILIRSHMDWNDENQTVETGGGGDTGISDGSSNRFLYAAIACCAALIGLGAYEVVRKNKRKETSEGSDN